LVRAGILESARPTGVREWLLLLRMADPERPSEAVTAFSINSCCCSPARRRVIIGVRRGGGRLGPQAWTGPLPALVSL